MSYSCKILADSQSEHSRLTTFEVTFPRFILAEVNTHRMLSRNSASSRAIPTETLIQRVVDDPFVPESFGRRVKGMGVGVDLPADEYDDARQVWMEARDAAVSAARALLHVDKSRANRLLEPFMWHTAIISATDWDNFFNLRCHPDAQPEFQRIARMMRDSRDAHEPQRLAAGGWHLPLIRPDERGLFSPVDLAAASAGRCARVSYDRHNTDDSIEAAGARWDRLNLAGHWSPGEHPAQATVLATRYGNFMGFCQLRKMYPGEDIFMA